MNNQVLPQSKLRNSLTNKFRFWLVYLTKPSDRISIEERSSSYLLNLMLVMIWPVICLTLLLLLSSSSSKGFLGQFSVVILVLSVFVVLSIFITNRLGFHKIAIVLLILYGEFAIMFNAIYGGTPHLEILFLILLPLISISLLRLSQTFLITIFALLTFFLFINRFSQEIPVELRNGLVLLFILESIIILFVAYWNHISEQQRLKLFVEHEKTVLMRELLSNISHDLKTPLSIINANLYLLRKFTDNEQAMSYIERSERQVWRLERSILDVLIISRLDNVNYSRTDLIDVQDIVDECLVNLASKAEQKNLEIKAVVAEPLPQLLGIQTDIFRLVENLVENAINYTPDGSKIEISLAEDNNELLFIVRDFGIGICPEDLSHIFDRFYRADQARSISTGGTGLGLAIVKRIVELHDGEIAVESIINQGTTFTVRLPFNVDA